MNTVYHGNVMFSNIKLSTGRISHHASHGALFYNRRNVLKSGRAYYECSETNCSQGFMPNIPQKMPLQVKNYQYSLDKDHAYSFIKITLQFLYFVISVCLQILHTIIIAYLHPINDTSFPVFLIKKFKDF